MMISHPLKSGKASLFEEALRMQAGGGVEGLKKTALQLQGCLGYKSIRLIFQVHPPYRK